MRVQTISQRRENPILNIKPTNAQNLPRFVSIYHTPDHGRRFYIPGVSDTYLDSLLGAVKGYRQVWVGRECHFVSII